MPRVVVRRYHRRRCRHYLRCCRRVRTWDLAPRRLCPAKQQAGVETREAAHDVRKHLDGQRLWDVAGRKDWSTCRSCAGGCSRGCGRRRVEPECLSSPKSSGSASSAFATPDASGITLNGRCSTTSRGVYLGCLREESLGPALEVMASPGHVPDIDVLTIAAACEVTVGSVRAACVPRKAVRRRRKTLCLCTGSSRNDRGTWQFGVSRGLSAATFGGAFADVLVVRLRCCVG
jgi:hypothetical protein